MTLDDLIARRALYLAAEANILQGQEYQIGNGSSSRRLRRADLSEVRAQIESFNTQILQLQNAANGNRRVRYFRAA